MCGSIVVEWGYAHMWKIFSLRAGGTTTQKQNTDKDTSRAAMAVAKGTCSKGGRP